MLCTVKTSAQHVWRKKGGGYGSNYRGVLEGTVPPDQDCGDDPKNAKSKTRSIIKWGCFSASCISVSACLNNTTYCRAKQLQT